MNYLSASGLSKYYGERVLFEELTFGLAQGEKVALVANNGTGKSTLMRILARLDEPDSGEVTYRQGVRVTYLEQAPELQQEQRIIDFIQEANTRIVRTVRTYEEAVQRHETDHSEEASLALERAAAEMEAVQAWDYDRRLESMLSLFGIRDTSRSVQSLSGGQQKRLALAVALMDTPDLLLLDEPTNHLDIEMIEWLEQYLMQSTTTLLMVTHDRYFLDRVCTTILEMTDGKLYRHQGNYAYFLQKRTEREEALQTEISKAGQLLKKELEWMRKTPQARTTKSKSRIDAFYDLKKKAHSGKKQAELKLEVKMSRIGGKVLELKKVYKSYGDLPILKGFDYTFKRGERIGIVGKNGVGKSTFLNILTGLEEADSGKINVGETVVYGYYNQSGIQLQEDKRVIEVLKDIADVIELANGSKLTASQFLQHFLFPPEMQYTYVSKLSGGERRRLHLLTVLIKNPNFLILDEPTNDLDLLTLSKLEEFLESFGGCLLLVSHDRYFMDKLVDHLFVFEGDGQIRDYWGPYYAYKAEKDAEELERQSTARKAEKAAQEPKKPESSSERKKLSFKEKYEYEELEKEIAQLETEKGDLEKQLAEPDQPYDKLAEIGTRLETLSEQLDEKLLRWMELDERA